MNTLQKMSEIQSQDHQDQDNQDKDQDQDQDTIISITTSDDLEDFCKKKTDELYVHTKQEEHDNSHCITCKRDYTWIKNKQHLIDHIQTNIDDTKSFTIEIAKLRYYMHLPCDEVSYFDKQAHKCWMCVEKEKKCGLSPNARKQVYIYMGLFMFWIILCAILGIVFNERN